MRANREKGGGGVFSRKILAKTFIESVLAGGYHAYLCVILHLCDPLFKPLQRLSGWFWGEARVWVPNSSPVYADCS